MAANLSDERLDDIESTAKRQGEYNRTGVLLTTDEALSVVLELRRHRVERLRQRDSLRGIDTRLQDALGRLEANETEATG